MSLVIQFRLLHACTHPNVHTFSSQNISFIYVSRFCSLRTPLPCKDRNSRRSARISKNETPPPSGVRMCVRVCMCSCLFTIWHTSQSSNQSIMSNNRQRVSPRICDVLCVYLCARAFCLCTYVDMIPNQCIPENVEYVPIE